MCTSSHCVTGPHQRRVERKRLGIGQPSKGDAGHASRTRMPHHRVEFRVYLHLQSAASLRSRTRRPHAAHAHSMPQCWRSTWCCNEPLLEQTAPDNDDVMRQDMTTTDTKKTLTRRYTIRHEERAHRSVASHTRSHPLQPGHRSVCADGCASQRRWQTPPRHPRSCSWRSATR